MIHIAPCSCELHQALREALERNAKLEAELARRQPIPGGMGMYNVRAIEELKARAEKAEANLKAWRMEECWDRLGKAEMLLRNASAQIGIMRNNNDELKARVAELERLEEFWHNLAALNVRPDLIERYLKNPSLLLPPDMIEGHEREAD